MRQAGALPDQADAQRFALFLLAQGIDCRAEAEDGAWVIWIRDEDRLAEAKSHLEKFRADPQAAEFKDVEKQAAERLRQEFARQQTRQGKVVDVRGNWTAGMRPPTTKRAPLVTALIVVSIAVAVLTNLGQAKDSATLQAMMFRDPVGYFKDFVLAGGNQAAVSPWTDIANGQVWRLLTPILLHFGIMHIVFNMYAMFLLGGQVEDRLGTPFTLALVLASAILPDIAQAVMKGPNFGGMSGVAYAMIGFIGVRMLRPGAERYLVDSSTIIIALVFMAMGIVHDLPGMADSVSIMSGTANWCHGVGLIVGAVFAWLTPIRWK